MYKVQRGGGRERVAKKYMVPLSPSNHNRGQNGRGDTEKPPAGLPREPYARGSSRYSLYPDV